MVQDITEDNALVTATSCGQVYFDRRGPFKTQKLQRSNKSLLLVDADLLLTSEGEPVKLIPTATQGPMHLQFKNYLFVPHFKRFGINYWRCKYFKSGCLSRVAVLREQAYDITSIHNH